MNGAFLFTSASDELGFEVALGENFRNVATFSERTVASHLVSDDSASELRREMRLRSGFREAIASSLDASAEPPTCLVVTAVRAENTTARLVMAGAKVGLY